MGAHAELMVLPHQGIHRCGESRVGTAGRHHSTQHSTDNTDSRTAV